MGVVIILSEVGHCGDNTRVSYDIQNIISAQ